MKFIDIQNIDVTYGTNEEEKLITALKGLSLQVDEGTFVAIIGKNGSGKSTLAKTLNGLILPGSGKVYVSGLDTSDKEQIWEIREQCGMVFQNPDNQLVAAVVEDDVAFGPENLGVPSDEIKKRVYAALEQVEMIDFKDKAPHLLSGGQKQRVAIAGVLAMMPKCIVLDEPTAMLDPQGRAEVLKIIKQLNADGITVVLITHFMEEAAQADQIIIMDDGEIKLKGTPEEIFKDWKQIKRYGLDIPHALEYSIALKEKGLPIEECHIEEDKLIKQLIDIHDEKKMQACKNNNPKTECEAGDVGGCIDRTCDTEGFLSVKNLTHIYSKGMPYETKAIDDVSFDVARGEFIGVIGHTGSGKSTLIQHLNGILKPDEGHIVLNGVELTKQGVCLAEVRKNIGLVFQYPEYQLFEETVEKDIAFGPKNLGLSEDEVKERVKWAMETVGLSYERFAQVSPFELSGGQKRRVAIAGVIAMKPEVLVFDEPTAGLDPQAHRDILKMISDFHKKENATIFLVSHNMKDVAELSDRVLVMDDGRLNMMDTPDNVFAKYRELEELGLALPPTRDFLLKLKKSGLPVKGEAMTLNGCIEEIIEVI